MFGHLQAALLRYSEERAKNKMGYAFLEGAMISASVSIIVGFLASTFFPPSAILAACFVGGITNAIRN